MVINVQIFLIRCSIVFLNKCFVSCELPPLVRVLGLAAPAPEAPSFRFQVLRTGSCDLASLRQLWEQRRTSRSHSALARPAQVSLLALTGPVVNTRARAVPDDDADAEVVT